MFVNLSWSLALIALLGAALATIVGAASIRDRFFGATVCCIVLALLLPLVATVLDRAFTSFNVRFSVPMPSVPRAVAVPFTLGHVTLGVVLIRRRIRGPEAARRAVAELDAARGRERPRLLPDGEDTE